MEVQIRQRSGDTRNKKILFEAAHYFLGVLLPDADITVIISICDLTRDKIHGDAELTSQDSGYIRLERSDDLLTQLATLAHEAVHIKQFYLGHLTHSPTGKLKWNGKLLRNDTPWEREAHDTEAILAGTFVQQKLLRLHLDTQAQYAKLS